MQTTSVSFPKALAALAAGLCFSGVTLLAQVDIPGSIAVSGPLTTPGAGLNGEYWKRPPVSILTDGRANRDHGIDRQIDGFGPANGTFRATAFVYAGMASDGFNRNDLTPVKIWLGGDGVSFAGTESNFDDGAIRLRGFINRPTAGVLNMGLTSDDGSRITIGGIDVAERDGSHGDETQDVDVNFLAAGLYPIEITFFNGDWTSDGNNHSGNPDPGVHGGANFRLRIGGADITPAGAAMFHPTAPRVPALLWTVGLDDNGWPAGNGGGANASFLQENGAINPLPGSPITNPAEGPRDADNDYYFAGDYSTVIAGNGAYAPVGVVAVNEEGAERAFAADDNDLRYHFNLPSSLQPLDLLSVTFDALNLHEGQADSRYGVEVYINGVKVQDQIVIRPPQLHVDYTTPVFSLASVNAQTGPGADNIVSLRGINYNADGGGNWMGIDYVQLNAAEGLAPGYLQKVRFNDIGNSVALDALLNHPKYINDQYDSTCLRSDFSANDADECDNCGLVVRGLFIPKTSGPHTFYISADDGAGLFLSTDEDPANKRLIAVEPAWTGRRNYIGGDGDGNGSGRTTTPSPSGGPQANISGAITLVAGNRYYIEGAVKEAGGGDNLDVAVQGPGDPEVVDGARPIFGDRIAAKVDASGSSLTITQNPAVARVPEGGEASFTVAATGSSPLCGGVTTYQWQRKGSSDANYTDIAGANSATYTFGPVRTDDHLSSYRCVVRVPGLSRTSAAADLEVLASECLRVVSAAGSGDFKHVTVTFSTFINPTNASSTDLFNYVVTGPGGSLTVSSAVVNSDGKSVTLTTDPLVPDADYVVEVTGVQSIIGSETCAAPDNQATFKLIFAPGFALKEYFLNYTAGLDALIANPPVPSPIAGRSPCYVNLWQMNTADEFDNYGGRISGFFVPAVSGDHVFYISSDDPGRLFLSTDANPANKALIAFEPQWNGRRQWLVADRRGQTSPSGGPQDNISGPMNLVAGQKYYIESWFTEGGGGDNMAVAVQGPGAPVPANDSSPITTAHIGSYITPPVGASATITVHPVDATSVESAFVTFTAAGSASSPLCGPASTYQWFRNDVPIIGATSPTLTYGPVTLADDGAMFKMRVAAVGVHADSAAAVLSINRDTAPPVVLAAVAGPAPVNVTLRFNELLKQSSAEDIFNYAVSGADPAVEVSSAVLQANGSNVVLTLNGALTVGRSYSVTVSFVEDLAGNAIVPVTLSFNVPTTGGYAAAVLADGPIAYWRFNDAPPTAANLGSLGAAANGTYNGGATPGSEALRPPAFPGLEAANTALQCNGTDAFVGTAISLMNSRPAFTISGWFRRNADQANRTGLWGQNDIVEIGYINNNTIELWTDNGLHQSPPPEVNPIPNGEWAHLAVTSDGSPGVAKMYTNGVLANMRNHSVPADNAFLFNIGGGGVFDGTGNFFNGQIDEVAVYGTALSAAQIQAQYQAAFSTPGFGFDDGQVPTGTIASGTTPPFVQDGVLHLTDRVNSQLNYWTVPLGGAKTYEKIKATWRTLIDNPGGADGLSFNLGVAPVAGSIFTYSRGVPEEGANTGLSVCIDTYNNGDIMAADAGLDIKWNGVTLTHLPVGPGVSGAGSPPELALGRFVNTSVEVTSSGFVTFQYDTLIITAQIPGYTSIGANQYEFAARTGGANENCWIDDVIFTGKELEGAPTVTITLEPVDQTFVVNPSNPGGATLLDQNFNSSDGGFTASGAPAAFTGAFAYDSAAGSWQVNASDAEISVPYTSRLQSPTLTIGRTGRASLTLEHRWSVENDFWDGTQVRVSINGGAFAAVPASAFTQGGYDGTVRAGNSIITGQMAWTLTSAGHDTGAYITSVANLGMLNAGDTVQLEFLYGGDTNTKGPFLPSWEITSIKVTEGIQPTTVTFTTAATATVPGNPNPPLTYQWSRNGSPIPGATGASYTFAPVIEDNGAKYRCVASTTGASAPTREATLTVLQNVPASTASSPPLSYPGGSLKGEYWQRPVNSILTDGCNVPANRIDTQIAGFGPANGTFRATGFIYLGNDLTGVSAWLAGDAASFVGTPGNLDDGAFRFTGYINIQAPGILSIGTTSDDGSRVKIGGLDIINNDCGHGDVTVDRDVSFDTAGLYPIEITYFNGDWTSDGNGHSGNPDPGVHGGANFRLRIGGADATSASVAILHSVLELIPPVISCPPDVTTRADSTGSAVVTYPPPSASDNSGSVTVVCVPPSGASLPVGDHTVTCTATDASGNAASCTFKVTVLPGNLPPTAVISSEQLIDLKPEYENPVLLSCNWWNACLVADGWTSSDPEGGDLTYVWTLAGDPVPVGLGPVVTNCLEVGQHTIILTVTDPTGLQDTDSKTIEIVTAPLAIELLIEQVDTAHKSGVLLTRKLKRELIATLRVALGHAGDEELRATQKALDAFEKKVRANVREIGEETAQAWIRWSQAVSEGMEKCIKPPRKGKDHDDDKKKDDVVPR